jgi:hypothetical protein
MRKKFLRIVSRHFILLYCFFAFLFSNANGQTYNGSLTLFSQADVDAFNYTSLTGTLTIQEVSPGNITNLNGLSELTNVGVNINIGNNSALVNLDGLSNVVSVGSSLYISHNTALSNINGLANLSSIGSSIYIGDNTALINIDGLSKIRSLVYLTITREPISNIDGLINLTSITGGIEISLNGGLTNLNGFANLNSVFGNIKIVNNSQLTNFCGLYTLTSNNGMHSGTIIASGNGGAVNICNTLSGNLSLSTQEQVDAVNYVTVTGNLVIREAVNSNISNLGGLANLTSLGGSLTVQNNTALSSYCGLFNLFNAGYSGSYTISGNLSNPTSSQIISGGDCPIFNGDIFLATQAQVDAFHYTGVTGNLTIGESSAGAITNLNALSQLTFVGKNFQIGHAAIVNLDVLNNLTSVGGTLTFDNPSLTNINGLSHVGSLGGLFIGGGNSSLTNINGLSHVATVKESIYIYGTTALTNLDGLSGLTSAGHIDITSNSALTSINGLSHLQTVKGLPIGGSIGIGLLIKRNNLLTNLNGLSGLHSIEGSLEIEENPALINLDGLINLKSITQRVSIGSNPALQNIEGLSNLQSFYPDHALHNILIVDNDALQNVNGLRSLQFIWSNLSISGNALLENIDGLSHLNYALHIGISANSVLQNLNGLSNVSNPSTVSIIFNSALSNFCGLYKILAESSPVVTINSNLVNPTTAQIINGGSCSVILPDFILTSQAEVDAFDYSFVPANLVIREDVAGNITNLQQLSQLGGIAGSFSITDNTNLHNLAGLSNLSNIGIDLEIRNEPVLNNIDALSNLIRVGGLMIINTALSNLNGLAHLAGQVNKVEITYNASLVSISSLAGIQTAVELNIGYNNSLTSLTGLQGTTTPEGVIVEHNGTLAYLNGLENVASVKNLLAVRNNDALINVDGLSGLKFVGGDPTRFTPSFDIRNNASLANLNGFSSLDNVEGNLLVANSPSLSNFCGLYHLLSTNGLGGTFRAEGNAANPTVQEIIDAGPCASSITRPTVTINQAATQVDPASIGPINFIVQFDQAVTGFTSSDITISGTAGATTAIITAIAPNDGTTYMVAISGMIGSGTIVASIAAGAAINASLQTNLASTSVDNTVTFILNNCPQAGTLNLSTAVGAGINFQLPGSDTNNDPLNYSISEMPGHGTLNVQTNGTGTYTAGAGYSGMDLFKYKVSDGKCDAEGTVTISIVVCPGGTGFWKNHPNAWPVTALQLGTRSYTKSQLLTILKTPVGNGNNADASLILADQLIPVKLNIANGAPAPSTLNDSIATADVLIGNGLIPLKIKPNSITGRKMVSLATYLANYNSGLQTAGCSISTAAARFSFEREQLVAPELYRLEQNSPNPFERVTLIRYSLPVISKVSLKVYDVMGREVATLVNEMQEAGNKTVYFDIKNLKAGLYYYRFTAGTFTDVKKMIVVK